ncbi:MAG: 50S ribosomal protein L9 [Candidatus Sumerlaeia bacterium]|nr:50S ribosomal protein L9 [Candidatus Sumerlaeia bacterium]
MAVKVILTKDVKDVGRAGTVKNVAPGYARNYLFPRSLAVPATEGYMRQLELKRKRAEQLAAVEKSEAHRAAEGLAKVELRYTLKAGEQGQLYGSVSQQDIADGLREKGFEVERRRVLLKEHIKKTGLHLVDIRLHGEVVGKVRVIVDAEQPPDEERPAAPAAEAPAEEDEDDELDEEEDEE